MGKRSLLQTNISSHCIMLLTFWSVLYTLGIFKHYSSKSTNSCEVIILYTKSLSWSSQAKSEQ